MGDGVRLAANSWSYQYPDEKESAGSCGLLYGWSVGDDGRKSSGMSLFRQIYGADPLLHGWGVVFNELAVRRGRNCAR